MHIVHLTASTFFGGPERQMLGLGLELFPQDTTTYVSFAEGGRCRAFLDAVADAGLVGLELSYDFPQTRSCVRELSGLLRTARAEVLVCHGYKSNLLGRMAARRVGIPVVSVSRGWTAESGRVRLYEWLDRRHLRLMDRVVAVSEGQAAKVRRWCGVAPERLQVIRNAARLEAFENVNPEDHITLHELFPKPLPADALIVVAAGRLSPEKGYDLLVEAAPGVLVANPRVHFILFGEGGEERSLQERIFELGIADRFILAGFRRDLDRLLPWCHLMVSSSFTEGLPNVLLEGAAAGLPIVATRVGGTPEVVAEEVTGLLVPPGEPNALASGMLRILDDEELRQRLGRAGRDFMQREFTFAAQARAYRRLFTELRADAPLAWADKEVASL